MRTINRLLSLAFLSFILLVAWMIYFAITPVSHKTEPIELDLKSGSSLRTISQQLTDKGLLKEPWSFVLMVRAFGRAGDIKAGNYLIEANTTPYNLFVTLTNGNISQDSITFIEGWTFSQMRNALNNNESVKHMIMSSTDQEILAELGTSETIPEGLFFPDTYYFSRNTTDKSILKRAYQAMQTKLNTAWLSRDASTPYHSPYEALIMASIVEKETGKASERPQIAGVFVNRLNIGMRLQTDPTVIYGLGEHFDGNLRKQDLLSDTPYNTYTRPGLPPSPIAMPGLASIEAALHPAKTNAIYFVGKGDGSHAFSSTLAEHNRAVVQYQIRPNLKR